MQFCCLCDVMLSKYFYLLFKVAKKGQGGSLQDRYLMALSYRERCPYSTQMKSKGKNISCYLMFFVQRERNHINRTQKSINQKTTWSLLNPTNQTNKTRCCLPAQLGAEMQGDASNLIGDVQGSGLDVKWGAARCGGVVGAGFVYIVIMFIVIFILFLFKCLTKCPRNYFC